LALHYGQMAAILTLLIVIAVSMFIIKVASIALVQTGMSRDNARFQARSAFTGVGFTTVDSEKVVKHPVRRRIITVLIILGSAGFATAIGSLILGFSGKQTAVQDTRNLLLLLGGIVFLFILTKSVIVDRMLNRLIRWLLHKTAGVDSRAYQRITDLDYNYEITEIDTANNPWLCGKSLKELNLPEEGVLVLGIARGNDTYLGAPRGDYTVEEGDRLVLYGKQKNLQEISRTRDNLEGKEEHKRRKEEHEEEVEEQDKAAAQE